jgi:hypothetical protein
MMRFLAKYRGGAPPVRAATEDDVSACATLARAFCRERGWRVARTADARFRDLARETVASLEARLLVSEEGGEIIGMVWCRLGPPEVWDDRPVFLVDWWYVIPARRGDPRTAMALLRAVAAFWLTCGNCVVRVCVEADQPHLVARYQREFGLAPKRTVVLLEREREADPWVHR